MECPAGAGMALKCTGVRGGGGAVGQNSKKSGDRRVIGDPRDMGENLKKRQ